MSLLFMVIAMNEAGFLHVIKPRATTDAFEITIKIELICNRLQHRSLG